MDRIRNFARKAFREIGSGDLFLIANDLSYKLILAIFPFIIFLMSLFSLLNLDMNILRSGLADALPDIIYSFMDEVTSVKSTGILSLSLILSINSSASGFRSVIKSIGTFYGVDSDKGFFYSTALSILLVFIFALTIAAAVVILVFGNRIKAMLISCGIINVFTNDVFGLYGYLTAAVIIGFFVLIINRFGSERQAFRKLIPGTAFTVAAWLMASGLFSLYLKLVSNFSGLYGSIGGIIALMYWLNILSVSLLLGAKINVRAVNNACN